MGSKNSSRSDGQHSCRKIHKFKSPNLTQNTSHSSPTQQARTHLQTRKTPERKKRAQGYSPTGDRRNESINLSVQMAKKRPRRRRCSAQREPLRRTQCASTAAGKAADCASPVERPAAGRGGAVL
jgi:hypothetical protein